MRWSCGNTKRIDLGDSFFLIRLGIEPKGIIGCGYVTSPPYLFKHWDEEKAKEGKETLRTDLLFNTCPMYLFFLSITSKKIIQVTTGLLSLVVYRFQKKLPVSYFRFYNKVNLPLNHRKKKKYGIIQRGKSEK